MISCHDRVGRLLEVKVIPPLSPADLGAVATFSATVCGGSRDHFVGMNPRVVPNAFVGRRLREAWAGSGPSAFETEVPDPGADT